MKTILIGIFAFILAIGIILVSWYYYLRLRYRKIVTAKYSTIYSLIKKLQRHESILMEEVEVLVRDATLRHATYRVLEAYGRRELFPSDLFTIEKSAEGFLVTWLEYPTELGEAPQEIEHFTTISLDGILNLTYYVFRYRMRNNHWAARYSWMFGVVGPYNPHSKPYDIPSRIFSRFNAAATTTPEEEIRWVHENLQLF